MDAPQAITPEIQTLINEEVTHMRDGQSTHSSSRCEQIGKLVVQQRLKELDLIDRPIYTVELGGKEYLIRADTPVQEDEFSPLTMEELDEAMGTST